MESETGKQLNLREKQALSTRKKLVDISLALIKENGFDEVSVKGICKEAGVSVGAFYHHFNSKNSIIIDLYNQCDVYFDSYVINNLKSETYYEKIIEYIDYLFGFCDDMGNDFLNQMFKPQIEELNNFFLNEDRKLTKHLYDLISLAQENKAISSEYSNKSIGNELLILARGIMHNWCQSKGSYDLNKFGSDMVSKYVHFYKI